MTGIARQAILIIITIQMNAEKNSKLSNFPLLASFSLCIVFSLYHIISAAHYSAVTFDEPNHFSWAEQIAKGNNFSRADSSHKSTMPATLVNYYSEYLINNYCNQYQNLCHSFAGEWNKRRFGTILFYLILIIGTIKLGTSVASRKIGLFSAALVALDASIIAHSALVTLDVAFAAGSVWLLYVILRMYQQPCIRNSVFLGVALGFCALTKYTVLLFFPAICFVLFRPLFFAISSLRTNVGNNNSREIISTISFPVLTACFASFVISIGFGFNSMQFWLGAHQASSDLLKSILGTFYYLPIPLPSPFIEGLDLCFLVESQKTWNVVVNNAWHSSGTWSYFISLFFYKSSPAVVILALLSILLVVKNGINKVQMLLLTQIIIAATYFSLLFAMQVGYRYVLFLIPLMVVFLSSASFRTIKKNYLAPILGLVLLTVLFDYKPFTGYILSYSNPLLVDRNKAYLYIADSNFDWAHTYFEFIKQKPENAAINPRTLQPGLNIFPAMHLSGVLFNFELHHWLRKSLDPAYVIANTYFAFDINPKNFFKYLYEERTFLPQKNYQTYCQRPKTDIILSTKIGKEGVPVPGTRSENYVCIDVKESDAVIAIDRGSNPGRTHQYAGIVNQFGMCEYQELIRGESIFFRLLKGTHLFCYKSPEKIVIQPYSIH